ncbi:hypothetical protein OEZ86_005657 [Tetradesmus obliquus]|nr:hypothetical protein OEZ86_005657 [Tetradesmus obliquus]
MSTAVVARPAPPSEPEKQIQKAIQKRIVDPAAPYVKVLQSRSSQLSRRTAPWLQPTMAGSLELLPPVAYRSCPVSSITSKYVHTCQNRTRCAVNCLNWTPDGRRCITGDNIGQLTLWNSTDFKFEQTLQSQDKGVRAVTFSHNGSFLFTCDDTGAVRILKSTLAPLDSIAAHQEACRAVAVAPTDVKFATCSDDQSVKVWDLATLSADRTLTGHGSDVRYVDWHPSSSLLASSGRDALIKMWDAREEPSAAGLATLHGHKGPVNQVKWNANGTWLLSGSRDQTVRVWDIRHTKKELHSWQGHTREVYSVAWHPVHLELLASGDGNGTLMFCMVGQQQPLTKVELAHEASILGLGFHPIGHMLATCSMEACTKMWVRPRPGDPWRDAKQGEQDDASVYSDLLASAAAGQQGAAAGAAAAAGQLPGGIAVQLPGGGGIPGLGVPAARPPGLAGPRPPGIAGPAAAAAAAMPGNMPGGMPGLMQGDMQGGMPAIPGLLPAAGGLLPMGVAGMGIPGMAGGAAGRGMGAPQGPHMAAGGRGMQHAGQHQQQHHQQRGFKRQRDDAAGGFQEQQQQQRRGGFGGGRGFAGRQGHMAAGQHGVGHPGLQQQQQYAAAAAGRGGAAAGGYGGMHQGPAAHPMQQHAQHPQGGHHQMQQHHQQQQHQGGRGVGYGRGYGRGFGGPGRGVGGAAVGRGAGAAAGRGAGPPVRGGYGQPARGRGR